MTGSRTEDTGQFPKESKDPRAVEAVYRQKRVRPFESQGRGCQKTTRVVPRRVTRRVPAHRETIHRYVAGRPDITPWNSYGVFFAFIFRFFSFTLGISFAERAAAYAASDVEVLCKYRWDAGNKRIEKERREIQDRGGGTSTTRELSDLRFERA